MKKEIMNENEVVNYMKEKGIEVMNDSKKAMVNGVFMVCEREEYFYLDNRKFILTYNDKKTRYPKCEYSQETLDNIIKSVKFIEKNNSSEIEYRTEDYATDFCESWFQMFMLEEPGNIYIKGTDVHA